MRCEDYPAAVTNKVTAAGIFTAQMKESRLKSKMLGRAGTACAIMRVGCAMPKVPIHKHPYLQGVPASFKAAGRKSVRGGRWSIRKFEGAYRGEVIDKPWRAGSRGKAMPFTRYFETHAEAIEWASLVASTFYMPTLEEGKAVRGYLMRRRHLRHNTNMTGRQIAERNRKKASA